VVCFKKTCDCFSMDSSDSDWLLGGEMGMECDLIRAEHKPRSRGFVQGGENVGDWSATHRLASWTSGRLCLEKDSPFDRLDIADTLVLEKSRERQNCGSCNRSRKFFCYSCCCALPSMESSTPCLALPIRVEVVKHHAEVDGKSTAVHAAIIAPSSVKIHTYPDIPEYDPDDTILVFPGKDSQSLKHILKNSMGKSSDLEEGSCTFPFSTVVFVDSTWNQCHGICQDPRLSALPRVELEPRQTMFWRHQKGKPREYLATIEAIYYFMVDYHNVISEKPYNGEYDNLLFYFKFMYEKIHQLYSS